jgi:hypothetical protein
VKKNGRKIKKYYFLKESTLTGGLGRRKVTRNSKKITGQFSDGLRPPQSNN